MEEWKDEPFLFVASIRTSGNLITKSMQREKLAKFLCEHGHDEVMLFDGLDNSFVGLTAVDGVVVAVYSTHLIIEDLMKNDKMDFGKAQEFMESHILNINIGEKNPVFIDFIPKSFWNE